MITCTRCGSERAALSEAPVPGPLGEEIAARVCAGCWNDWSAMEIKVINELRLNFMEPEAQETLARHMRDFLFPAEADPAGRLDFDTIGEPG